MNIYNKVSQVRNQVKEWKRAGLSVGFVPTMGYLHEGHESLIRKAASENDKVVVSIFVNPTQFGPNEDLEKYPRDLKKDSLICAGAGADLIFHPEVEEMYVKDACTSVNMNGLTDGLCGKSRPTHFSGVCTVVTKLFNIVPADKAYFGEKDAQQLAIIKKMVEDLNIDIQIIGCPIIREEDGLAKSSRNIYLSPVEREAALVLNKSLKVARKAIEAGVKNTSDLKGLIVDVIEKEPLAKIDYVEIVDSRSLKEVDFIEENVLVALAVYIGKTRLIDNFTYFI
ncbi:MAG: pantoate--beta-alanine ligase [Clostridium sp.]|nr:pantoate--beta-alanine ligase [Clostridium sp.]MDU7082216.1 pantoate--beta-alanine ligase [Clostridium sp.]